MRKAALYFIVFFICTANVYGQDPHFSQFNEQPALINPALTGVDNAMRASVGYKDQWQNITTPYRTYGASFETRLKPGNWQQVDKFRSMTFKERSLNRLAMGFSIYKDKAGDGNLDLTQANVSIATFIPTGTKSFLSCGIQAGIAQRRLNTTAFVFPNQFTGTGYDAGMVSNENFSGQNFIYPDASAGIVWSYNDKTETQPGNHKHIKATLGFSVYHINRPRQMYLAGDKNAMFMKYTLYGDFLIRIPGSRIAVAPKYLVQLQGTSTEVISGFLIKYYTAGESKYTGLIKSSCISYGVYYRNKDAVIANLLLEWKEQYAIGLSYDINVSRLTGTSSGRGGLEIMLRYTPPRAYLYQMKKKADLSEEPQKF